MCLLHSHVALSHCFRDGLRLATIVGDFGAVYLELPVLESRTDAVAGLSGVSANPSEKSLCLPQQSLS